MQGKVIKPFLLLTCLVLIAAGIQAMAYVESRSDLPLKSKNQTDQREKDIPGVKTVPVAIPAGGVPVLMYHSIGNEPNNDAVISPERFKSQMDYLYRYGYHPVTLDQLYSYLAEHKALPVRPVVITFDDGYRNTYTIARPVLKKYGFVSTLFLPAYQVGKRFSTAELREMEKDGMEICAHGFSHCSLDNLSETRQLEEIRQSKKILDVKLNQNTRYFCYPNGRYNHYTRALLKEQGFQMAFTMTPGWVRYGDDLFALRRIWMGNAIDLKAFTLRLNDPNFAGR